MKKLMMLVMVAGLTFVACQSDSSEDAGEVTETEQPKTEAVEQEQPAQPQAEPQQPSEVSAENYDWNSLVQEYNQLWCKYSDEGTSAAEKEKIYPRLKELQEKLDEIYASVQDQQEKQALYQAMAKMVECN